jgi:hypothetical protein
VTRLVLALLVAAGLAAGATSCGSTARVDSSDVGLVDAEAVDAAPAGISFGDDGFGGCLTFCPKPSIVVGLSCPAVVTAVNTSGPCVGTFACAATKGGGPCLTFAVQVSGTEAGVCQVVVVVADASSYMADVTFQQEPASECCPAGLTPMPVRVSIDDSESGCAYPYGSATADASLEAAVDAGILAKDGSMEAGDAGAGADATSVSDAAGDG